MSNSVGSSIEEETVDTARLVSEVEAEVARRRSAGEYSEELLGRLQAEFATEIEVDPPEILAAVESSRPLRSDRPVVGRGIVFGKRVVRRLLAWYIAPIAEDVTRFNLALLRDLRSIEARLERVESPLRRTPGTGELPAHGHVERLAREARVDALVAILGSSGMDVRVAGDPAIAALLRERGISVVGDDPDPIHLLDATPAATAGAVVLTGVLPLLSATELLSIVPMGARALRPRGLLLADAPDARQAAGADPTDVDVRFLRWLHPETLSLLAQGAGLEGLTTTAVEAAGGTSTWFIVSGRRPAG